MASYYKQVCSSCSATESNGWKKVEELGTWVCCDCFDDIIAENVSSDEEVTREISTRRYTRVTRSAKVCPQQSVSSNLSERGRRWIFKRRMPLRAFKTAYHPYTSNSLHYKGVLYKTGDVVKVHGAANEFYYAQLRKFLTIARLEKSASVLWLQPKYPTDINSETDSNTEPDFNPSDFLAGREDDRPIKLDAVTFVMRLPLDHFKSYLTPFPHVPIEPEHSEAIYGNFPKITQQMKNSVKHDVDQNVS